MRESDPVQNQTYISGRGGFIRGTTNALLYRLLMVEAVPSNGGGKDCSEQP